MKAPRRSALIALAETKAHTSPIACAGLRTLAAMMSSRSAYPAVAPSSEAASAPPAGPLSSSHTGKAREDATEIRPLPECIRRSFPAKAARPQASLQPVQVLRHQRLDVGVGAGDDAARVLADLGRDRDRKSRQRRRDDRRRLALVARFATGVQETDGDRLHARGAELQRRPAHVIPVERDLDRPSRSMRSRTSSRR